MARALAALIAAVVAASMLWSGFHVAAAAATGRPAGAYQSITAVDAYGGSGRFSPGIGYGDLYFDAYDSGTATTGTVKIIDPNATRDGVPNPAAQWTITFHSGYNDSAGTSNFYVLPYALNYSGDWEINLTDSDGSVQSNFSVWVYAPHLSTDRDGYLPGHTGTVYWSIERNANYAAFSNVQTLALVGWYYTNTDHELRIPSIPTTLAVATIGNFSFTVPLNASTAYTSLYFEIFANQSGSDTSWSTVGSTDANVGAVTGVEITLVNCGGGCPDYPIGAPVLIAVSVFTDNGAWGDGLTATLTYYSGTTAVATPAGTPTSLTTNASGAASVIFIPSTSEFSTTHNNSVRVTITDPADSTTKATNSIDFYLVNETAVARVQVTLPQLTYYSGDTVTASWTLGGATGAGAPGWSPNYWVAYASAPAYQAFAVGYLSASATSGTVGFTIPASFQGSFVVEVGATNATTSSGGYAEADVVAPALLLNPSETSYHPGDTITISVTTEGQVLSGATLYDEVQDDSGNILSSGTVPSSNSFSFTIPKVAAPEDVEWHVVAETSSGGVLAVAEGGASLVEGYELTASVQTSSSYSDGSYQPGETVSISYSFSTLGTTPLPGPLTIIIAPTAYQLYQFEGGLMDVPGAVVKSVTSDSGTISFTIPSGTPNGYATFLLLAYPASEPDCQYYYEGCSAPAQLTVNVQSSPSALNYELSPGSGLTVGWLVLLLIVIVLAIIGILWARRRMGGGGGAAKWSSSPKPFSSTPPAEGASGAPAGGPPSGASGPGTSPPPGSVGGGAPPPPPAA